MAGERKPATVSHCVPFHWYLTYNAAVTDSLFMAADPVQAGVNIAVPGADLEYRIERIHLGHTVAAGSSVTIKAAAAGSTVWGAHLIPAGFASVSFGESPDKSRSGMACGANKAPVVSLSIGAGGSGCIEVFGYCVPVK